MTRSIMLLVTITLTLSCSLASGQSDVGHPRESIVGKWMLDSKKSSGLDSDHNDEILTITYKEPTLMMERNLTRKKETKAATIVLFTDKRGETTNPFPFIPSRRLSSTTEWQGNILVRTYKLEQVGKPRNIIEMEERYELREGDNLLVVTVKPVPGARVEVESVNLQTVLKSKRIYRRIVGG